MKIWEKLDFSYSLSKLTSFNTSEVLGEKASSCFAIIGLIAAARYAWTPAQGFYKHFIRPRNDLKAKYGGGWAIVTGASDGIGEAMCYELAGRGFDIVLMARSQEKLEKVAKKCEEEFKVQTRIEVFDFSTLSNMEGVDNLKNILEKLKEIDISLLVNNVGKAHANHIHEHSVEAIFQMIHVNICSQTFMSVFVVPLLLSRYEKTGKKSAILNYSSSSVADTDRMIAIYAATKAYNMTFSKVMLKEYKDKIDVLTITPRNVKTQMNSGVYLFSIQPEEHAKAVVEAVGRDEQTWGHYLHGMQSWLFGIPAAARWMNNYDQKKFQNFMEKKKAVALTQQAMADVATADNEEKEQD